MVGIAGAVNARSRLKKISKNRADGYARAVNQGNVAGGPQRHTLAALNQLPRADFVRVVGPVFEHSPWIAESAWAKKPFANLDDLHHALCEIVKDAGEEKQLALIRAHPDLVGKLALAGQLTKESTSEQASAGLDKLSPEEIALFQKNNADYKTKFDFPFIICARLNKKDAILKGFAARLSHYSRRACLVFGDLRLVSGRPITMRHQTMA